MFACGITGEFQDLNCHSNADDKKMVWEGIWHILTIGPASIMAELLSPVPQQDQQIQTYNKYLQAKSTR